MRKLLTFLIVTILIILNISLIKGSYQSSEKLAEISQQEAKVQELEAKNKTLRTELEKRNSPYYIESEARDRLNFGRSGETTIVVEDQVLIPSGSEKKSSDNKSNLEKWFDLITN